MRFAPLLALTALALGGCDLFDGNKTTVSGTILDRETRQPVPGVPVVILGPPYKLVRSVEASTTSDTQGRYRLETSESDAISVYVNYIFSQGQVPYLNGSGQDLVSGKHNQIDLTVTRVPQQDLSP